MRKKVGIIKRVSCLALIFLLSINSFAAIVSDNDGSAFITKAEFDALKSSFQAQIDTYNQGIDSKIDSAIASYLNGINIGNEGIDIWSSINSATGNNMLWRNYWPGDGDTALDTEVNISTRRSFKFNNHTGFYPHGMWFIYGKNIGDSTNAQFRLSNKVGSTEYDVFYWGSTGFLQNRDITAYTSTGGTLDVVNPDTGAVGPVDWYNESVWDSFATKKDSVSDLKSYTIPAANKIWMLKANPNGTYTPKYYYNDYKLVLDLVVQRHQWKDYRWRLMKVYDTSLNTPSNWAAKFRDIYIKDNGRYWPDSAASIAMPYNGAFGLIETSGGKVSMNEEYDKTYDSSCISYAGTTNNELYQVSQWGTGVGTVCHFISDVEPVVTEPTKSSKNFDGFGFKYERYAIGADSTQNNKMSDLEVTWYQPYQDAHTINPKKMINEAASSAYGENIYIGGGMPIFKTGKKFTGKLKIKIKIKSYLDEGITEYSSDRIHVDFSDKQFINGSVDTAGGARLLASAFEWEGWDVEKEIPISDEETTIWVNCWSEGVGHCAKIESLTVAQQS